MAHPVSFFQIQGGDPRALIKFYQKAFGWRGTPAPDGSVMIAAADGGIPGAVGPSSDGGAHVAVYVTVDDVTKHLARAKRAGASVAMHETRLPADLGSIGGIIDPAGNWLGLWAAPSATNPKPKRAAKGSGVRRKRAGAKAAAKKAKTARRAAPRGG
ncbi:MAG TPA: VOC family protein [Polyangiaceae bacterium]|nr:VOC family protein [Polyangiaceae bacterium]